MPPLLDSRAPESPRGKLLPSSDVLVFTSGAGGPISAPATQGTLLGPLVLESPGTQPLEKQPLACYCPREMHNRQTGTPAPTPAFLRRLICWS